MKLCDEYRVGVEVHPRCFKPSGHSGLHSWEGMPRAFPWVMTAVTASFDDITTVNVPSVWLKIEDGKSYVGGVARSRRLPHKQEIAGSTPAPASKARGRYAKA